MSLTTLMGVIAQNSPAGAGGVITDPHIADVLYVNNDYYAGFDDQSPAANTVFEVGTPTLDDTLLLNGNTTLGLDGSSALHVTGTSASASIANSDDFTWEAWVYIDDTTEINTVIGKRDAFGAEEGRLTVNNSGDLRWDAFRSGSSLVTLISDTSLNPAQWYHVAVSRTSNVHRIFIDGVVQTSTDIQALTPSSNGQDIYIGDNRFNTSRRFTGNMGPVRITHGTSRYSASFTPEETFPVT